MTIFMTLAITVASFLMGMSFDMMKNDMKYLKNDQNEKIFNLIEEREHWELKSLRLQHEIDAKDNC